MYEDKIGGIDYDTFRYLWQRYPDVVLKEKNRMMMKKEVCLEKALMAGANNTGIIFILKQMGWKDNPDINVSVQTNIGEEKKEKFKRFSADDLEKLEDIYNSVENEGADSTE